MQLWKAALAALVVVWIGLVDAEAHASNCVPGAQTQCACPGGGAGVQICSDDGSRLGVCSNCTMPVQQQPMPMQQMQPMQPMQPMYMPQPREMRRASPGLWLAGLGTMLGGIILVPIGGGLIVGGAVEDSCEKKATALCVGGGVAIGLGLVALAAGIVMMAIGGTRVPVSNGSPQQQAWWIPTPRASSLAWTF